MNKNLKVCLKGGVRLVLLLTAALKVTYATYQV